MQAYSLYTDVDGTLVCDGAVSPENRAALEELVAAGGRFSVATGRSELGMDQYLKDLPINLLAILYNGAAVYDFAKGVFLHRELLAPQLAERLLYTAMRFDRRIGVHAFTGGPTRILRPGDRPDPYLVKERPPTQPSTVQAALDAGCIKLLFHSAVSRLPKLEKALRLAVPEGGYILTYSAPYYLEVLPQEASKGDALKWIVGHLHLSHKRLAAIGDYENDVSMLKYAPYSAAPEDAHDKARTAAKWIVAPHTQHAVADFIHRLP